MRGFWLALTMIWALPWTLLGLAVGLLGVSTGGSGRRVGRTLEFHGGLLAWLLLKAPITGGARALTLGHTILGRTREDLEATRSHELVHVAQYERWGLLFLPAYFGWAGWLWLRGRDPYWDNPFEREAYSKESDDI